MPLHGGRGGLQNLPLPVLGLPLEVLLDRFYSVRVAFDVMLRRLTAMIGLVGLVLAYRPSPSNGCDSAGPMPGAMLQPAGAPLPDACGQPMTAAPCPTGPCAALPQTLTLFVDTPDAPIAIEFIGRFHNRTPPPPEPPPPQA